MLPDPGFYREWQEWARQAKLELEQSGQLQPLRLPCYLVAELPSPQEPGMLAVALDEAGGLVPVFSDDAGNWRRVTDRNVVSA